MGSGWNVKKGFIMYLVVVLFFVGTFSNKAEAAIFDQKKAPLIVINKKTNELAYFKNGELVKTFPVATGKKPSYTPEGTFKIVNKIKNRPYYKEKIPGGDPKNPLGKRWLGLDANGTNGTTYAIHGNNNPRSIGKYVSAGCVRMHNEDVEWLFDEVKLNTKVVITTSKESLETIAAAHIEVVPAFTQIDGQIYFNGEPISFAQLSVIYKGFTLVPLRKIFEILGATVEYDLSTQSIKATKGDKILEHKIGSKTAKINGKEFKIDIESKIVNGHTMVPLRFVSEVFDVLVEWKQDEQSVYIYSRY